MTPQATIFCKSNRLYYFLFTLLLITSISNAKTTSHDLNAESAMFLDLKSDSLALVDLYNATSGGQWTNKTNWLTGRLSTWFGVTVSAGRVTKLQLPNNKLSGTIPTSIGNLSAVTIIYLYLNNL